MKKIAMIVAAVVSSRFVLTPLVVAIAIVVVVVMVVIVVVIEDVATV